MKMINEKETDFICRIRKNIKKWHPRSGSTPLLVGNS